MNLQQSLGSPQREVRFDRGRHYRAKIGYLLLATEQTIQDDVMALRPEGVGMHFARTPIPDSITVETLGAIGDSLAEAASLILPDGSLDVICYACTSGSIVLGDRRYEISQVSRHGLVGARWFATEGGRYAEFLVFSSSYSDQTAVGTPWVAAREVSRCNEPYNAFVATLVLGIELGIAVAIVASMLVVFARMSTPHRAELGQVPGTTTYRNTARFDEVETFEGIRIVRIDAALSFINAANVKRFLLDVAEGLEGDEPSIVLDASGINDIDATGADMMHELLAEMEERNVAIHLADVKGPVRDVLHRSGLWDEFADRIHPSTHDAVAVARGLGQRPPTSSRSGRGRASGCGSARPRPAAS